MKKVLIISNSRLDRDPRILRQIRFLRDEYEVFAMGLSDPQTEGATFVPCWNVKKKRLAPASVRYCEFEKPWWVSLGLGFLSQRTSILNLLLPSVDLLRFATHWLGIWNGHFEKKYWSSHNNAKAKKHLSENRYDFIIANDLNTLPLAVSCANGAKVLFDSHEYAPEQSGSWEYRLTMKPMAHYQLKTYGKQADSIVTVSPGFIGRFKKEYGLSARVMTNAPFNEDIAPSPVIEGRIRMVHHGFAAPQRKTARMVELMDHLDDRFELDFMLIDGNRSYLEEMKKRASGNPKIRFVPPVPTMEIARTVNKYDIGLYALYPTCYNAEQCLPNKFFEFINGSLALAITPVEQMAKLVRERELGVVGEDMSLKSLATELNRLDTDRLTRMKRASYEAAKELNAQRNGELLREIFREMEGGVS